MLMGNFITEERLFMEIRQGYSYHIKDEFFELVQDKYLMSNKEQGNYRPHYYAIQDKKNLELYWMIPISSQAEKYKGIIEKKKKRYETRKQQNTITPRRNQARIRSFMR